MFPDFGSYLKPFAYKHPKTRFAILQDCPFQQKIHNFAHWFAFMFELFLLWTIIEAQVSILQDRLKRSSVSPFGIASVKFSKLEHP